MNASAATLDGVPGRRRTLLAGIALLFLVFAVFTAVTMQRSWAEYEKRIGEQLQSINRLKKAQLEDWLDERKSDALLFRGAYIFSKLLPEWLGGGHEELGSLVQDHLDRFYAIYHHQYDNVLLCDINGEILMQAGKPGHVVNEVLREKIRRAAVTGRVEISDLYRVEAPLPAHSHLDFVAPIRPLPPRGEISAVVVLRADARSVLYPFLQNWPVPSDSAETMLFRREQESVRYLNEPRRADGLSDLRISLSQKNVLSVQAMAPDYRPGALLEGIDYRGVAVMGVADPVTDSPWWLLAKVDKDEIFLAARRDMVWIGVTGLLFWMAAVIMVALVFQRRELLDARQRQDAQNERLRALGLLSAIADGSADVIFAKDLQGRYSLFNRAASRYVGKSESEVLGRDDSFLFTADQAAMVRKNDRLVIAENRVLTCEESLETVMGARTFLAVKGPLHDSQGGVIGMYGIARDISERASDEEALRRNNEELERFNRAMVDRENVMIELKQRINALSAELGREAPFDLASLETKGEEEA